MYHICKIFRQTSEFIYNDYILFKIIVNAFYRKWLEIIHIWGSNIYYK